MIDVNRFEGVSGPRLYADLKTLLLFATNSAILVNKSIILIFFSAKYMTVRSVLR